MIFWQFVQVVSAVGRAFFGWFYNVFRTAEEYAKTQTKRETPQHQNPIPHTGPLPQMRKQEIPKRLEDLWGEDIAANGPATAILNDGATAHLGSSDVSHHVKVIVARGGIVDGTYIFPKRTRESLRDAWEREAKSVFEISLADAKGQGFTEFDSKARKYAGKFHQKRRR